MPSEQYEAWCFPTERNTQYKPRRISGPYLTRDDAEQALYADMIDEPSPDKHEYYSWRVVPVASPPLLRFTAADSERANDQWNATCGPHSIAAACGLTLDEVRPALANYKGWMSPTQIAQALLSLKKVHSLTHHLKTAKLCEGINRVQWEGKWLNPGVPARVAYFHTHWVAHFDGWVLCTACLSAKWIRAEEWRHFHLECDPPSPFHITHHYVLTQP